MPVPHPTYAWPGVGLLRASTAPTDLPAFGDLDLAEPGALRRGAGLLAELRQRTDLRAALAAASPDLLAALDALDPEHPELPGGVDERRLRRLITATSFYLLRWQHRATPFGLFAGIAPLRSGPAAASWSPDHQVVRQVDAVWLAEILTRLHTSPDLLDRLTVTTNTAITRRGNRLVAAGPTPNTDEDLAAVEVSVRASRPVLTALEAARGSARVGDLSKTLTAAFPAASSDQITTLLAGLIEQNLLISNLNPPASSPDALGHVCAILRDVAAEDIPDIADLVQQLFRLHHDLTPAQPLTRGEDARVGGGGKDSPAAGRVPLIADTVLDSHVELPERVGAEAARAAAVLCRLSPYPFGTPAWRDYHSRFLARYGTGQPVPVLDLVGDGGLGFPAGYLGSGWGRAPRAFTARDEKLLTLVQEALAEGRELVLTDPLVEELADDSDAAMSWPERVEIGVQVHGASAAAIDGGRFTLLVTATPRSGSSMAGRHAHHLPADARTKLAATFTTAIPGAIAVQLSFGPRRRRNAPLAAAIPLLDHLLPLAEHPAQTSADPSQDAKRTVAVDELAVVAEPDRFYLLHQPSGRQVEIRCAHALEATTHLPPLARLLSEISTARSALYAGFHFGTADRLPYLPRVRYRRTILAAARWLLPATALPGPAASGREWDEALAAWRGRWSVPAHVSLVEDDRRLPLDLNQPLHRHLLRTRADRTPRIELREDFGEAGWIGRAHELLLPLRLTPPPPAPRSLRPCLPAAVRPRPGAPMAPIASAVNHRGDGLPGASAVVYARLLAHPARWDELLIDHLPFLLDGFADPPRWWFGRHHDLRHPDREPYLALFLELASADDYGAAARHLATWTADLIRHNLAAALTLDTFCPQPGRYGHGPALEAAHAVFAADSAAVIAQITLTHQAAIPAAPVTATSMLDLATALTGSIEAGARHLVTELPRQHRRLDPALRETALRLTETATDLHALPGGADVTTAWQQRATAMATYRTALSPQRDPMTMLPVLLRDHHRRAQGNDGEQTVLRLARACALRRIHRAAQ